MFLNLKNVYVRTNAMPLNRVYMLNNKSKLAKNNNNIVDKEEHIWIKSLNSGQKIWLKKIINIKKSSSSLNIAAFRKQK